MNNVQPSESNLLHQCKRGGSLFVLCLLLTALVGGCGGGGGSSRPLSLPTTPSSASPATPAGPTLTGIRVGVLGDAEPSFQASQTKQLWALGSYSDGSTQDLTNVALWQTSNPVVATVSPTGLLSTGAFGGAAIDATVRGIVGTLGISVTPASSGGCRLSVSPPSLVFDAFSRSATVTVTVAQSDCRWTVASDASWLPFRLDPGTSGGGRFSYSVPGNSTTQRRSAHLIVTGSGGETAIHSIEQEAPHSCSYVVTPDHAQFPLSGGTGTFQVDTTPNDCRWTASISSFQGAILSGASGTGDGPVTFRLNSLSFSTSGTISINGLSGENPPGVFTFETR